MISTESYSPQWIESICEKFGYKDKNLLEKVIRAFVLLEMLVKAGAPITFKGGSAILLLLKDSLNRLDVLYEDNPYANTVTLPLDVPFVKQEGAPVLVKVPSKEDILGDKLTTF